MPSSSQHNTGAPNGRLGTEPVGRLLLEYALPAIIAMVASSLYNIVDRVFIGNGVGPEAIAGLAVAMPLMNITAAFGAMVGVGSASIISIRLGQKRLDDATHVLGNALLLNLIIGTTVAVCGLIWLDPLLRAFGASERVLPHARDFMRVILLANLFNHNFLGLNNIMRATGYPRKAMLSTFLTVGVNLLLAPLFIFGFHWGLRGAALATASAQFCGFVWVMWHFCSPKHNLHFRRGFFHLRLGVISDIVSIGSSNFLMNLCTCLVVIFLNKSLAFYGGEQGDLAIGAYGVCNAIVMLFIMTVLGLNQGMQPIVGYNFGARQNGRMLKAYRLTIAAATCVTTLGFVLGEIFPVQIASAFTGDEVMRSLAARMLRIILFSFPVVGYQMVTTSFFQAIGKAGWSIFLSLTRQLIFLIPALLTLPRFFGLDGVIAALPTGDVLASILTFIVIMTQIRKYRRAPTEKLQPLSI